MMPIKANRVDCLPKHHFDLQETHDEELASSSKGFSSLDSELTVLFEPRLKISQTDTAKSDSINETKAKLDAFRNKHKLSIITSGPIPTEKRLYLPPSPVRFFSTPNVPKILKVYNFEEALKVRLYVERLREGAPLYALKTPAKKLKKLPL